MRSDTFKACEGLQRPTVFYFFYLLVPIAKVTAQVDQYFDENMCTSIWLDFLNVILPIPTHFSLTSGAME